MTMNQKKSPPEIEPQRWSYKKDHVSTGLARPGDMLVINYNSIVCRPADRTPFYLDNVIGGIGNTHQTSTTCIVLACTGDWPLILVSHESCSHVLYLQDLYVLELSPAQDHP